MKNKILIILALCTFTKSQAQKVTCEIDQFGIVNCQYVNGIGKFIGGSTSTTDLTDVTTTKFYGKLKGQAVTTIDFDGKINTEFDDRFTAFTVKGIDKRVMKQWYQPFDRIQSGSYSYGSFTEEKKQDWAAAYRQKTPRATPKTKTTTTPSIKGETVTLSLDQVKALLSSMGDYSPSLNIPISIDMSPFYQSLVQERQLDRLNQVIQNFQYTRQLQFERLNNSFERIYHSLDNFSLYNRFSPYTPCVPFIY